MPVYCNYFLTDYKKTYYFSGVSKSPTLLTSFCLNKSPDTITVTLTPIGQYQELFVEKINGCEEIIVKNNSASGINCHYYIMGERIDTEKNITEYEGTWDDYPGDNSTRSIVGKDYDVR